MDCLIDTEELARQRGADKTLNVLMTILDNINALVYVTDMETHERLFVNKYMREAFDIDSDATGSYCWQIV